MKTNKYLIGLANISYWQDTATGKITGIHEDGNNEASQYTDMT